MWLCKRANRREKEEEKKKTARCVSGYTCSVAVSLDRIRSPARNERNDSELYQRSTWSLRLTTIHVFVRNVAVLAGDENLRIGFTWTGISQIGFVRTRITLLFHRRTFAQTCRPTENKLWDTCFLHDRHLESVIFFFLFFERRNMSEKTRLSCTVIGSKFINEANFSQPRIEPKLNNCIPPLCTVIPTYQRSWNIFHGATMKARSVKMWEKQGWQGACTKTDECNKKYNECRSPLITPALQRAHEKAAFEPRDILARDCDQPRNYYRRWSFLLSAVLFQSTQHHRDQVPIQRGRPVKLARPCWLRAKATRVTGNNGTRWVGQKKKRVCVYTHETGIEFDEKEREEREEKKTPSCCIGK